MARLEAGRPKYSNGQSSASIVSDNTNFNSLVELAMKAGNRSHMRPVIEKELLHYDLLFALDEPQYPSPFFSSFFFL